MGRDMFAGKALYCDCGYEVRADDDDAFVEAIRRHAWEAHAMDFSVDLALDVARRAELLPSSEHQENGTGQESVELLARPWKGRK
jgi:predicted small metal-binding protein